MRWLTGCRLADLPRLIQTSKMPIHARRGKFSLIGGLYVYSYYGEIYESSNVIMISFISPLFKYTGVALFIANESKGLIPL